MNDWRTRGNCDPSWPLGDSRAATPTADEREAMHACLSCPVLAECDALAEQVRPVLGVWAGRTWRPVDLRSSHVGAPLAYGPRKTEPRREVARA